MVLRDAPLQVGAEQPEQAAHEGRQRGRDLPGLPAQELLARGRAHRQEHDAVRARPTTAGKGPADAAAMTSDEHRRGFRTFAAALLGDFDRYLERAGDRPDPARDRVGYRQAAVWVTDAEFDALVADLAAVLRPRLEQRPDGDARRRVISIVNLPAD